MVQKILRMKKSNFILFKNLLFVIKLNDLRKINKLFIPLFLLFTISCSNRAEQDKISFISPENAYSEIIERLDLSYPGRGLDIFDEQLLDRPMAYGLILSAESNRYKFTEDSLALKIARVSGQWLLDNSDINDNGIHGYGLADAWDAFSDNTINPANQEYTITTAIAIKGLIDWYKIEKDSLKRKEISKCILNCIIPYLDSTYDSPIGIPAYSLNLYDIIYDVYNPAIFLAGQMQRFSRLIDNDSLRKVLSQKSETIIEILFSDYRIDENGNYYWDYGVQIKQPNDLVHACYILEGIRDYKKSGGNINTSWDNLSGHFDLFYVNNRWYEYIVPEYQNEEYNCRLWALGMLMYSLALEKDFNRIELTLWPQINEYYTGNGQFKLRINNDRIMLRQNAHLLLGLSYYLFNENSAKFTANLDVRNRFIKQ